MEGLIKHTLHLDKKYKSKTSVNTRHKAYLEYFNPKLNCKETNKYSNFLYTSSEFAPYKDHIIETIDVLKNPYVRFKHNPSEKITLINLGTYFKFIRSINFWVSVNDYARFIECYTPHDYMDFCKEHNRVQEFNKTSKDSVSFPFDVYASSAFDEDGKFVVQPIMFYRSNPCHVRKTGKDVIKMHYELDDIYNQKPLQEYNLKIIKFLQYGREDVSLTCLASGELLESAPVLTFNDDYFTNCWTLHHIVFINGKSILKTGIDPAKLLRTVKLDDPKYRDCLLDVMGTIILSKSEHAKIHHSVSTGGIEMHTHHAIPWVLRDEHNFQKACARFNLDINYDDFYNSLKSDFYTTVKEGQ